jgi:hypothetical protein
VRLITILRCAMVAMIVALPATAGCRQPFKSQLMASRDDFKRLGLAHVLDDAPEPMQAMDALFTRG